MEIKSKKNENMKAHELKTWPEYFFQVVAGKKTFEIRKNDRMFEVEDILILKEWKPRGYSAVNPDERVGDYTGNECAVMVTYVMRTLPEFSATLGVDSDFVVMSIQLIN